MALRNIWANLFLFAACVCQAQAFAPQSQSRSQTSLGIFDKIGNFFEELDAFVDDATSRRLGAGASFYGKRKSNFYGENDTGRKRDRNVVDPTEDYRGPTSTGLFKWMEDENGQLQPVTRMKEKNLSKKVNWDRVYAEAEEKN
mmetsp:Transcript_43882/g.105889  ORF Transcript_43882/g.105889 Transcript_43882/m.105889 type:complete len:143 (+) Transcript_43882:41-469(+)